MFLWWSLCLCVRGLHLQTQVRSDERVSAQLRMGGREDEAEAEVIRVQRLNWTDRHTRRTNIFTRSSLGPMMLVWIYARQATRVRLRAGGIELSDAEVYTPYVRAELAAAGTLDEAQLAAGASPAAFSDAFARIGGFIVGLALLKPLWSPSLLTYLGRQERQVRDFWMLAGSNDDLLAFVEVVAVCSLLERIRAHSSVGFSPRGLFFEVTGHTMRICSEALATDGCDGRPIQTIVQSWSERFNGGVPLITEERHPQVALAAVVPHALLLCLKRWRRYAVPVKSGKQASGLGLHLARELLRPFLQGSFLFSCLRASN